MKKAQTSQQVLLLYGFKQEAILGEEEGGVGCGEGLGRPSKRLKLVETLPILVNCMPCLTASYPVPF